MSDTENRLISRRAVDMLFIVQVVLNIVVLAVIAAFLVISAQQISVISQRQIEAVQHQNDAQLCAQHDIVIAVKKIGLKLGLPVRDIVPPDVQELDCP